MNGYSEGGTASFHVEEVCPDVGKVPGGSIPEEVTKQEILRKLCRRLQQLETPLAPDWPPLVP